MINKKKICFPHLNFSFIWWRNPLCSSLWFLITLKYFVIIFFSFIVAALCKIEAEVAQSDFCQVYSFFFFLEKYVLCLWLPQFLLFFKNLVRKSVLKNMKCWYNLDQVLASRRLQNKAILHHNFLMSLQHRDGMCSHLESILRNVRSTFL